MTEIRGGLSYSIEVEDNFTSPLRRFREELAKTKEAARSGRVNASESRRARASADPAGSARTKNAQELGKVLRSNSKEVSNQARLSRLATTRAKQETAELRKQEVAERRKGAEAKRVSEQKVRRAKELADLEKADLQRKEQAARTDARLEREKLKTRRDAANLERSRQQTRQAELRAEREGVKKLSQEDDRASRQTLARTREATAEVRKTRAEQENASKARINSAREQARLDANVNARRAAADVRAIRRAKEATEQERNRTQVQKTTLNAKRAETQELNKQRAALLLLRAQERGRVTLALRLRRALQRVNQESGRLAGNFLAGAGRLIGFSVIFAAFAAGAAAIRAAASSFLSFNVQVEKAQLGIAALLTAVGTVSSAIDGTVAGAQGLALAQGEAVRQTALLRKEGLQTAATFEQLLDTSQQALGPGLQAGLNVDEIRKFSVRISQAASAIGVPQNQLAEEIRSLLAGTINPRTTRIATSLGITNEDIRRAKEAGDLIGLLNTRFAAFDEAGKVSLGTFEAIVTNTQDAVGQLLGTAGVGLFDTLKDSLLEVFNLVTDTDPITGALLPDPELVARLEPVFDGVSDGIKAFRASLDNLSSSDISSFLENVGGALTQVGNVLGLVTTGTIGFFNFLSEEASSLGRIFTAFKDNPTGSVNEILGAAKAAKVREEAVRAEAAAARAASKELDALFASVDRLNAATITSNASLAGSQKVLQELEKASSKLSGKLFSSSGSSQDVAVARELSRLDKERLVTLSSLAKAVRDSNAARTQALSLSREDQELVNFAVNNGVERVQVERRIAQERLVLARQEQQLQAARAAFRASEALSLQRAISDTRSRIEAQQEIADSLRSQTASSLLESQNRSLILSLAQRELTFRSEANAAQRTLNGLAQTELDIRARAERLTLQGQAVDRINESNKAQAQTEKSEARILAQIQKRQASLEQILKTGRTLTTVDKLQLQLEQRKFELAQRKAALANEELARDRLRVALLTNILNTDQEAFATGLALAQEIREKVKESQQDIAQDKIVLALEKELDLQKRVQSVEKARNKEQQTASQSSNRNNSGGATSSSSSARGPQDSGGFSAVQEQGFQNLEQSFNQTGQVLGAALSNIITESIVLEGQERGEVLNSYESLFGAIGGIATRIFKRVFSAQGALSVLGSVFAPVGIIGGAAGFNEGGLVGPNAKGALPSPAHFSRPRGFFNGGAPVGLHPSDNIPIWVGAEEYIQPKSAVRHYGTQFMEAVRRLEIDPFQARALAKGRRPVLRPSTGGFNTGGQVTPGAQSQPAAAAGPAMAYIVSSPDQLENLLDGGAGALEDYMGRNAGEIRSRLGL